MRIEMTVKEFEQLRKMVKETDNPSITYIFNRIFGQKIRGINYTVFEDTIQLNITEKLSLQMGDILIPYMTKVGRLAQGGIASLPKIPGVLKYLKRDFETLFANKQRGD